MKGRKPTPKGLKVISGTDRADRETPDAPSYDLVEEFPEAPANLNIDGASMWNTLGPQLVTARVLQIVDLYILEQLCYTWQRFKQKSNAGSDITASENNAMKALFSEMGISPASRRFVTKQPADKSDNPFVQLGKRPQFREFEEPPK